MQNDLQYNQIFELEIDNPIKSVNTVYQVNVLETKFMTGCAAIDPDDVRLADIVVFQFRHHVI